jgi:glycogen debranching enzyme
MPTSHVKIPQTSQSSYHVGTVWPHDNSLIAAGFRNYRFDEAATKVFCGIVEAASHFGGDRLPEVFAGFSQREYGQPVHYPVACHPQAWAAGSVPFMVQVLLGLVPDAFEQRLHVVRPILPATVRDLEVSGLRVGSSRVDLKFERMLEGTAAVHIAKTEGPLQVVVEKAQGSSPGQGQGTVPQREGDRAPTGEGPG